MADADKIIGTDISNISKLMNVDIGNLSKFIGLDLVSYSTGIDKWDDGSYRYIGGAQSYSAQNAYLRLGKKSTLIYANLWSRFVNVNVPQGANITSAFVKFTFYDNNGGTTHSTIKFHDVDDAPRVGTIVDYLALVGTTASVAWVFDPSGVSNGDRVDTPDISAVVQEIVDRVGWAPGQAMSIICSTIYTGYETLFWAYDQDTYPWTELHIEYS